jgi:hypothetical protein
VDGKMQTLARILMGLGGLGLVVFSAMLVIYMKHVRPELAWRREGEIKMAQEKLWELIRFGVVSMVLLAIGFFLVW